MWKKKKWWYNNNNNIPDRPCCIDERCSRDGFADGLPVVVADGSAVVAGDVVDVVAAAGDAGGDGDAAAGADEPTKPPIPNSAQRKKKIKKSK